MTRLILLRHGETEWNVEGRYQGQLDSALARHRPAALYSSDLGRAHETARACADAAGLAVVLDARLREQHLGRWQGLLQSEIQEKFPAEFQRLKGDPDFEAPSGESARQCATRILTCLEEIAGRHPVEQIAVVTHGGAASVLLRHTLGIPLGAPRRFERPNASWNVFLFGRGRWFLETWGDVSHLSGPAS
jgi:broad specificity phosphatase PhoE